MTRAGGLGRPRRPSAPARPRDRWTKSVAWWGLLVGIHCLCWSAGNAAPPVVDFRGYLQTPEGLPEQGRMAVTFRAYADSIGGSPLWSESHPALMVTDGYLVVSLGSVNPLPRNVLDLPVFWIEITVRGQVAETRRKVERAVLPFAASGADSARWAPVPPKLLPDGRTRIALFDFGPWNQVAPHRIPLGADDRIPSVGWFGGPVRTRSHRVVDSGPYYCDFVEGEDASLALAVHPPDSLYRVILTMGDTEAERGPVDILVGDQVVARKPATKAGEMGMIPFEMKPAGGFLVFRVRAQGCASWALVGLDLYGPKGGRLAPLFPGPGPRNPVPPADSLSALGQVAPRDLLRSCCTFLMSERLSDGMFSYHGSWYENAYPIRTLLAGGVLLNEPTWSEAAFKCLDRFVAEQHPDGGWYTTYLAGAGCTMAGVPDSVSSNLADIGPMSLCLALAAPHADRPRHDRYLRAARRYADRIALPAQMPDGAFPNGLYRGRVHTHPYSVATATQAASLVVLGAVTRNARYSKAAEKAGLWLAGHLGPDGSVILAPYDSDQPTVLPPTAFGDVFYIVEALMWLERHTARSEVRDSLRRALDRYLWASNGLQSQTVNGYWWKQRNLWSDSKMGGILYVLAGSRRWNRDPRLNDWIERALAWLGDTGLSRRIGVMAPLPSMTGIYGMVATGMAGQGVAELVDPQFFQSGSARSARSSPAR